MSGVNRVCWIFVSVAHHYLLYIFFSFLLGKKVGEEAVSLNPTCPECHQWYVWVVSFYTHFHHLKATLCSVLIKSLELPFPKQVNPGYLNIQTCCLWAPLYESPMNKGINTWTFSRWRCWARWIFEWRVCLEQQFLFEWLFDPISLGSLANKT